MMSLERCCETGTEIFPPMKMDQLSWGRSWTDIWSSITRAWFEEIISMED